MGLHDNIRADETAGTALTYEMMMAVAASANRFPPEPRVVMGPKEWAAKEAGRHPFYPPSDPAKMGEWERWVRSIP